MTFLGSYYNLHTIILQAYNLHFFYSFNSFAVTFNEVIRNDVNSIEKANYNNLSQSNVEESKGQATFVIEVNHDLKEDVEQPTSTITTTKQKRGGFTCLYLFSIIISKLTRICLFLLFQKSLCLEKSGCI